MVIHMIRLATGGDAENLLKIYAQYIDTPITFEYTLPAVPQFQSRINRIASDYPYLVYERDGQVLGYAYAHELRERAAYRWDAECSIYLDQSVRSMGIGTSLYTALLKLLRLQGIRSAYGCVTLPNEASQRLHLGLNFTEAGIWHQAGYKNGSWHDVIWYELLLTPHLPGEEPLPPLGIYDLAPYEVQSILDMVCL